MEEVTTRVARLLQNAGTCAWVLAAASFHAYGLAEQRYSVFGTSRFPWTVAYTGLLVLIGYAFGLPDLPRTRRYAALVAIAAVGVSLISISLLQLLLGQALLPRAVVLGSGLVLVPWTVLCCGLLIDQRDRLLARDRVVVVAGWADAAELSAELESGAERPAVIVEVLTPDQAAAQRDGTLPLSDAARRGSATVVVLDRQAQLDRSIVEQAASLHAAGVRMRTLSLFYEEWLAKLPISELERVSLMFDIGEIHQVRYGRIKRIVDIVVGAAGCVALALVIPFVLAGNLIANRGPLWFRQERVGKNGTRIRMLKFRTMRPDAPSGAWTSLRDPRVTPFGNLLRRSHLDELPQMLNILRGDLSIVGPRPEQPAYVDELSEKLPFYHVRHLVRPGLTGWAQVKYGYASTEADAVQKLQYEFYYLRHQCFTFDLRVMFRTIRTVVGARGR